jgi:hypothetical protein
MLRTRMFLKCGHCKKQFVASARQEKRSRCSAKHQPKFGYSCSVECQGHLALRGRDPNRKRLSVRKLAYSKLSNAVAQGKIIRPEFCEKCDNRGGTDIMGRSRIEGHHLDYSKPLEVIWLCDRCHKEETPRARGQRVWASRFTENQVKRVRKLLASGKGVNEIGRMFGVTHKAISDIRDGINWGWLK